MGKLLFIDISRLKEIAKKSGSCGLRARHKLAILERDGFKCVSCGKTKELTIAQMHSFIYISGTRIDLSRDIVWMNGFFLDRFLMMNVTGSFCM